MSAVETNNIDALRNELASLQARQAEVRAMLKGHRVRKTRSGEKRAPREGSLTHNLISYLESNGPVSAATILDHFAGSGSNVKSQSVRTLISALAGEGKILRSGKRGSFLYSIVAEKA